MIPNRRFVYKRMDRLDELVGLILARTGSDKRRLRSLTGQLFGSGGGGELKDPDQRAELFRDVEAVEDFLNTKTGTIDEPAEYFYGRIELYKAPFVDVDLPLTRVKQSVAYFTGATARTILMLAGPLDNFESQARTDSTSQSVASGLVGEPEVALAVARAWKRTIEEQQPEAGRAGHDEDAEGQGWQAGIVGTYYRMKSNSLLRPRTLEFLARNDERVPAEEIPREVWGRWGDSEPKDVQVGKALFVAERI